MYLNVIDDIVNYLVEKTETADHKFIFGQNLFVGAMPEKIKKTVTLRQEEPSTIYNYNNKTGEETYPISIRIRGTSKENETRAIAKIIHDLLEDLQDVDFEDYRLIRGSFETKPYQLEPRDLENNYIYVALYIALVERKEQENG
jgi:hypothetical protein